MSKIKVGDKVRVVRKVINCIGASWVPDMDVTIGKVFTISEIEDDGLNTRVRFSDWDSLRWSWTFPMASVELVQKFIDGVAISPEEFERRTAKPVEMSPDEILKKFNVVVKSA